MAEKVPEAVIDGVIDGTVSAGVDTAINGGSFEDNLADGLQWGVTRSLGAAVATEIGNAAREQDIGTASKYIAHAALGGAMDVALGGDGVGGAVGAVVGEATAEVFLATYVEEKLSSPEAANMTAEEFAVEAQELRATGANLSALSAGMTAALLGKDVDTAGLTGKNAADNNALFMIPIALGLLEVADKALQAKDVFDLAKAISEGRTEEAAALASGLALGAATDAIPGNVILTKLSKTLDNLGLSKAGKALANKADELLGSSDNLATAGAHGGSVHVDSKSVDVPDTNGHVSASTGGSVPSWDEKKVLVEEVAASGRKISPERVVDIRKLDDGSTVWLEQGTDKAGLKHILQRHELEFAHKGIAKDELPKVLLDAVQQNNIVGRVGTADVYRIVHNGVEKNIAIGIGSNGFIVRANPVNKWKELR